MKKKSRSSDDDFLELETTHEGKATFKFIDEMDKRGKAFKRMLTWAMANDLSELILEKMPTDRKYGRLRDALQVGEGPKSSFAVFVNSKARNVKKIDAPRTLIYVKPRRMQSQVGADIKILADHSPWTVDTIPFWPDRRQAFVVQRKVDKRLVERINKLRIAEKSKVDRELSGLGQRSTVNAMARRKIAARKAKAVPDIAFEMLTLEFGGGGSRGLGMWRNSLKELYPGRVKSVLRRYKQIKATISNPRSTVWRNWPRVDVKVKQTQLRSFVKFQKQLGY